MDTPRHLPNGYRHIAFPRVDSTNTIALEYYRNSTLDKLWITAEVQSKGKGSRGRSWESQAGNLYASLLLRRNEFSDKLITLTFVAGLALYKTLARFVSEDKLFLKWPNDILLNGAKVSGILLETCLKDGKNVGLVIGIGVNCQCSPNDPGYAATNLRAAGAMVEPPSLFDCLFDEMDNWLNVWDNGENFAVIRREWRERAMGIGRDMIVEVRDERIQGVFEDIDQNGFLILKTSDNMRRIVSVADIFFVNNQENA